MSEKVKVKKVFNKYHFYSEYDEMIWEVTAEEVKWSFIFLSELGNGFYIPNNFSNQLLYRLFSKLYYGNNSGDDKISIIMDKDNNINIFVDSNTITFEDNNNPFVVLTKQFISIIEPEEQLSFDLSKTR